ncbi:MAG: diacylglycerol kinase (ATP dependent) [Parcubacteria bacterium C7867-006]|nr:MAG: diacylglycerol kinase (ATP dependent) [Parcubacteria bacterium C7867-006]
MLKKSLNSFGYALRGIKTTWQEENNFQIMSVITVAVLFIVFYFDFTLLESALVVISITVVLSFEMMNTAIEDLCNKIEPNQDPVIGKIKDISSGFVLLSSIGALIVGIIVFYSHFSYLFN